MKFTFYEDSYYDSPGCSCCDGWDVFYWNSDDTDPSLGTAHSIEDCHAQALITFKGYENLSDDHINEIYLMSLDQMKADCLQYGITVEIVQAS